MESGGYSTELTVSKPIRIVGGGGDRDAGAFFGNGADLTFENHVMLESIHTRGGTEMRIEVDRSMIQLGTVSGSITVAGDDCVFLGITGGGFASITFESGTENGIVDASSGVSVTDNGDNTVGDIA